VTTQESQAFAKLIGRYSTDVQATAEASRKTIFAIKPDALEDVDEKAGVIGYGNGPGYAGMLCTLILSKKGVKLGLVGSASWPDPHGLLQGTGKVHRYLPLSSPHSLTDPQARELLIKALSR
jgi:hypothetical protein